MLFWTGLGDTQYVSGFCLSALLFLIPAPHRKVKTPEWTKIPYNPSTSFQNTVLEYISRLHASFQNKYSIIEWYYRNIFWNIYSVSIFSWNRYSKIYFQNAFVDLCYFICAPMHLKNQWKGVNEGLHIR